VEAISGSQGENFSALVGKEVADDPDFRKIDMRSPQIPCSAKNIPCSNE
jgi:hypothetical protein